jgi:predicted acylesterase/phospholipase RssA
MQDISNNIIESKINHIVISGGGTIFFPFYGYLRDSNKNGLWNFEDIKTIYGTSAGSVLGAILCLNIDWDHLDDYIILRPWKNIIQIDLNDIFRLFETKGFKTKEFMEKIFTPMLESKNLSVNITLKELYEYSKIDLHIFTTEVNSFQTIDLDAVYASCSVPILFSPLQKDDLFYFDGGLLNNFPIGDCLLNEKCKEQEILSLDINIESIYKPISKEIGFLQILLFLILNILYKISNRAISPILDNTIIIELEDLNMENLNAIIDNADKRRSMIQIGSDLFSQHNIHETL